MCKSGEQFLVKVQGKQKTYVFMFLLLLVFFFILLEKTTFGKYILLIYNKRKKEQQNVARMQQHYCRVFKGIWDLFLISILNIFLKKEL